MATIKASVELDRPVEEVFDYVADSTNDPVWCKHVLECEQTQGNVPALGATYRAIHKPGPKATELTLEVIEIDRPQRIAWRQTDEAGTFIVSYDLEALPGGRTRLNQTDGTSWNGIFRVLSPIVHLAIRRTLPKQFEALRAQLQPDTEHAN
jgi:uncharacterized protein YndB with AHSA1/START domain